MDGVSTRCERRRPTDLSIADPKCHGSLKAKRRGFFRTVESQRHLAARSTIKSAEFQHLHYVRQPVAPLENTVAFYSN